MVRSDILQCLVPCRPGYSVFGRRTFPGMPPCKSANLAPASISVSVPSNGATACGV
ncbi:hypothetical protein IG631_08959 [Alternaria alternata]|nr:hypothetical protein IG631_08959 [Alternaria alternata]